MKKLISLCLTAFVATSLQAQVQTQKVSESEVKAVATSKAEKYAEITFDTLNVNFGDITQDNPIRECTFHFKSTGTAPLVLHQVYSSCGCTVPTWSKKPVKPGEEGVIEVRYDGTDAFPQRFSKTITVYTNCPEKMVRLTIEGNLK